MPERTRFGAGDDEFDTESFEWEMALDIVREERLLASEASGVERALSL
jgi:hypothetical protein